MTNEITITAEQAKKLSKAADLYLDMLYKAQGENNEDAEFCRGLFKGYDEILNYLGIEHEKFSALGYMDYQK